MITRTAFGEQVARRLGERFHDVRLLHAGENGLVFGGRDPMAHDERRALRVPFPDEATQGAPTEAAHAVRFHRLVELAQAVPHPHIARIFETEMLDGVEVAITELAGPLRLDHLIASARPATVHRILSVLHELASALDALHQQGIVHGALRPSRVMLDPSGHVKLTGMLLRAGEVAQAAALSPSAVGDPAYMAPEQWKADVPTPAMDIYAVGVIAYELYTAEPRVTRLEPAVAVHPLVVATQRPLRPDLPLAVNEAIRRATHPDPAARFPSVTAFVDALAAPVTPPLGAPAIPPPPPPRMVRSVFLLALLVAILLALIW